ncbi:cell division protein ZipA [Photobacterium rosenbergii]|uniref:Cell division protein ZipA n=1 Tax=Photobacterium rosenbergii TaxID=294936 RepID=A0A2T3NEQ3_9GAMM|nr:ATP-binding protein [Photobacterium rosenbergii]PSW12851.1 cell division protein ZipA [Photobacterium rosenbergii]
MIGKLVFFCGKMGAGKSTKSKQVAIDRNAVLISEDEWLAALYPGKIATLKDYVTYSSLLKPLVRKHVQRILLTGTNVVMDFPANTQTQRAWFSSLVFEVGAEHELIYLQVSNEQCLKQLAQRRIEQPERAAFDTKEVFNHITQYFEEPRKDEGLNMIVVTENT